MKQGVQKDHRLTIVQVGWKGCVWNVLQGRGDCCRKVAVKVDEQRNELIGLKGNRGSQGESSGEGYAKMI